MATSIMDSGAGNPRKERGVSAHQTVHVLCTDTSLQEPKPAQSRTGESRVVIGICRLVWVPVAVSIALITQRSEVQILPPQSGPLRSGPFSLR